MSNSITSSRSLAWGVWIIASVFYAYQYILRVMPNIMLPDIMEQFGISAATFGQFSGVYYIGYSLMHLPIGIMLDRYGPKKNHDPVHHLHRHWLIAPHLCRALDFPHHRTILYRCWLLSCHLGGI